MFTTKFLLSCAKDSGWIARQQFRSRVGAVEQLIKRLLVSNTNYVFSVVFYEKTLNVYFLVGPNSIPLRGGPVRPKTAK